MVMLGLRLDVLLHALMFRLRLFCSHEEQMNVLITQTYAWIRQSEGAQTLI